MGGIGWMDAQDDSAAKFEFDERSAAVGRVVWASEFELEECRWLFGDREIRGGAPPVNECLIGDSALAAEYSGTLILLFKIPDDTGLFFVGVACA
jgi:hypothetical protein